MRTGGGAWHHMAVNCNVFSRRSPVGAQYLRIMNDGADLLALNLAWLGWELARWQEVIDWSVSALGALTLVILNLLRLRKAWRQHKAVEKDEK